MEAVTDQYKILLAGLVQKGKETAMVTTQALTTGRGADHATIGFVVSLRPETLGTFMPSVPAPPRCVSVADYIIS